MERRLRSVKYMGPLPAAFSPPTMNSMNAIHCPYCNARVTVAVEQLETPHRVACPRCGEAVPVASAAESNGHVPGPLIRPAVTPSSTTRRGRNRRVGLALLGFMLLLATVIAVVLVNTRDKRRMTMLAESPTLGYLPDDTNAIIAISMEEAERSREGREALDRLGFGTSGSFDLEKLVGLKREQIEEAILGMRVDRNLIPRLRLIVRTRSTIDLAALKARLNVKGSKKDGDREYDLIQPAGIPLEFALWLPTPKTVIAIYPPEELEKVPADPKQPVERFAAPLVELLKSRAERDTFFWLVAHSDDWSRTSLPLLLTKLKADDRKLLLDARTFGVGLRKDSGVTATRSRPARVTELPDGDPRGIAMDLVFAAAPGADVPGMIGGLQNWIEAHKFMERDANSSGLRHSVTLVGTPEDWERAFAALRELTK